MTHDAFLQAIIESADDDTVRLIYADFLDENGISDQGVRSLIRSQFWPNLHWLGLSRNPLGDAGTQEFLSAPLPTRLFCLFLMHCQVTAPLEKELRERFGARIHV